MNFRKYISTGVFAGIILLTIFGGTAKNRLSKISSGNFRIPFLPDSTAGDTSIKLKYPIKDRQGNFVGDENKNPFYLDDPSNIQKNVEYDPATNQYIITETIGNDFYRNPEYMSFEEFMEKENKKSEDDYFQQRAKATTLLSRKSGLPQLKVPIKAFERVFGCGGGSGSTIDIRPQGNIDLTFGARYNKTFNPLLTKRQQRQWVPEFDMDIQMNVLGKIGEKLKIMASYNTKATFDLENQLKLEYTGCEDEIIKKIEAGNVSFPLRTSLITGNQSLFGIKTQLQFSRLTVTNVLSQQNGQKEEINIQNGAQTQNFNIQADQYEENRHFLLGHYFREHYNSALANLPSINSGINITKIEVWVTAIGTVKDARDVVGFMDLGEDSPFVASLQSSPAPQLPYAHNLFPAKYSNKLYQNLISDPAYRDKDKVVGQLKNGNMALVAEQDFKKYRAKLLSPTEFTYNAQLGYISLNQSLDPNHVLAVAYQYTYNGETYQVGDFAQDIPSGELPFLKLLKSSFASPKLPIWNLMMKNVYSLNAYQINKEDFRLDILYTIPGGGESRFIPEGTGVKNVNLLRLLNMDRLNSQGDAPPDGVFDFLNGITINQANGKLIFPVLEPFGEYLYNKFRYPEDTAIAKKYIVTALYDSTKAIAQQLVNRFTIKGTYKSSVTSEISLGAFNLPQGSVKVTAGGQVLVENQDYTVDYSIGRIKIINEGIFQSGVPIKVSYENNATFGFQKKTLFGTRLDYWINDNFTLGGTFLRLSEKPITKKVNMGDEPIANSIIGVDANYHTESRALTKAIDKLPFIQTKEPSAITFSGEFAKLIPGHSKAIGKDGTAYIDDFEGTKSTYDLRIPYSNWSLASTPSQAGDELQNLFPEADLSDDLSYGYNRAKLAWYTIDVGYFRSTQSTVYTKQVLQEHVFPQKTPEPGQSYLNTLDLSYYPDERGPYNYDIQNINSNGTFSNPANRWGGIMRRLETTDFEGANIEFLEFWVMDPFKYNTTNKGELFINLGNVSEDILKDAKMFYENGLPKDGDVNKIDSSVWGVVPKLEPITNSFDTDPNNRTKQDVGFDGLSNAQESTTFGSFINTVSPLITDAAKISALQNDPSSDNYVYRDDVGSEDVLLKYKNFNGAEGNSQITTDNKTKAATNNPDTEDLNRDNTVDETESYFQYRVHLDPARMNVGENFITDKQNAVMEGDESVTWYQFKIPVTDFDKTVGSIEDFKSIRFMRMFLTGFQDPVVLRFARLELTRNQWRRYRFDLIEDDEYLNSGPPQDNDKSLFNLTSVSIEENSKRDPINYVLPPGIDRNQVIGSVSNTFENEQALSMQICNLQNGYARAVFKTLNMDIRSFKKMQLFVHAESVLGQPALKDGELTAFVRMGSDFTENYYEYEIPLKVTLPGIYDNDREEDRNKVWPREDTMDVSLSQFTDLKLQRDRANIGLDIIYSRTADNGKKIKVVGNPDLGKLKDIMIGVRNPPGSPDEPICAEVWFNELRMSEFEEKGGWAALARTDFKLADLGNVTVAGSIRTAGFGSLEQKVSERSKEEVFQYDAAANLEMGKFLPKKSGIKIPMYVGISESFSNPKYDPYETDILLKEKIKGISKEDKDSIKKSAQDYNSVKSINFTNVKKDKTNPQAKRHIYDVENLNLKFSYSRKFRRNPTVETNLAKDYTGGLGYGFNIKPNYWTPFEKLIGPKIKPLKFLREFTFNIKPTDIGFRTDMTRHYEEYRLRQLFSGDPPNQTTYPKQFLFNRYYTLRFSPTKSISVDFNASNIARIDEPDGKINSDTVRSGFSKKDSVWKNIKRLGRTTNYNQSFSVNYNVPLNKIKALDWIQLTARYGANYDWLASNLVEDTLASGAIRLIDNPRGHTIQNTQNRQINSDFNMKNLYNKFKYLRKFTGSPPPSKKEKEKPSAKKLTEPDDTATAKKPEAKAKKIKFPPGIEGFFLKTLISLKRISLNYTEDKKTLLPGFKSRSKILGMTSDSLQWAPGGEFVFGEQWGNNDLIRAGERNWISSDTNINQQFTQSVSRNLNIKTNFEWINDIRLDLNFTRTKSTTASKLFKKLIPDTSFTILNPQETGSFSISYFSLGSLISFKKKNEKPNHFKNFEENTKEVSAKLGAENPHSDKGKTIGGYADGYGPYSQEVLIPAFLQAYGGKSKSLSTTKGIRDPFLKIPKPNWRLTYTGLSKLKIFKKLFTNVNVSNGYTSTYSIGGYTTSLNYDDLGTDWPSNRKSNDTTGSTTDFISKYSIPQITIAEQLSPLIGIDMTLKNNMTVKFEFKKSRTLAMSFVNYQMNETKSTEFTFGFGYKRKGLPFSIRVKGKKKKLDNDLVMKMDVSYRNSKNSIYKLYQDISEPTSGQRTLSISPKIDYTVSNQLTISVFYDRRDNFPLTSASYRTVSANMGVMIRFTLTQ